MKERYRFMDYTKWTMAELNIGIDMVADSMLRKTETLEWLRNRVLPEGMAYQYAFNEQQAELKFTQELLNKEIIKLKSMFEAKKAKTTPKK